MKSGNKSPLAAWSSARLSGRTVGYDGPILPIPIVAQTSDFSCGAAVLLSVLKYWFGPNRLPDDEKALWGALGTNPISGTDPEPIAAVAREAGLQAEVREGLGAGNLPGILEQGTTAILAVQAWEKDPSEEDYDPYEGHWVVLAGIRDEAALVMDPARPEGIRLMEFDDLARRWHGLGGGGYRPGLAVLVNGG